MWATRRHPHHCCLCCTCKLLHPSSSSNSIRHACSCIGHTFNNSNSVKIKFNVKSYSVSTTCSYVSSVPLALSSLSLGPSKGRRLEIRGGSGVGTSRGVRVREEPPPRNILRRQECRSLSAWSSSPPLNPTNLNTSLPPLTQ